MTPNPIVRRADYWEKRNNYKYDYNNQWSSSADWTMNYTAVATPATTYIMPLDIQTSYGATDLIPTASPMPVTITINGGDQKSMNETAEAIKIAVHRMRQCTRSLLTRRSRKPRPRGSSTSTSTPPI